MIHKSCEMVIIKNKEIKFAFIMVWDGHFVK